jgi:hypothetical protein
MSSLTTPAPMWLGGQHGRGGSGHGPLVSQTGAERLGSDEKKSIAGTGGYE